MNTCPDYCDNKERPLFSILLVCTLLIFVSCTRTVYVPVLQPAMVEVGTHIREIAVVDRTTPENPDAGKAGSILTSSIAGMNREAAQRAIAGVVRTLEASPRYGVIYTTERLTTSALPGHWPPPLSWEKIDSIAFEHKSDAILVLESFDSDFIVTDGSTTVRPREEGGEIFRRRFNAGGVAGIKLGFRLYDVQLRAVADEFMFNHNARWEASGNAVQMVVGGLIDHRQAVIEASLQSGIIYGERISPHWFRVNREFFTKGRGNRDFKIGVRRATVNDWEGAREAWHKSAESRRRKTAGRSAFNLALMYEIEGELDVAREWAQYSYTDYGIKKARQYVSKLERRIRDRGIAEE